MLNIGGTAVRTFLYNFAIAFNYFILFYVIGILVWQIVQLVAGLIIIYTNKRQEQLFELDSFEESPEVIPISIIAPAYNEGAVIVDSVKAMLNLDYPVYEVVIVNDGSKDDSLKKLIKEFDLKKVNYPVQIKIPCAEIRGIYRNPEIPHLTLVDKENGGSKSDACNAGLNTCRYPYFIKMDSDCLLDKEALTWIARSFMSNKNCLAVGGMMRLSNGNDIENYNITNFKLPKNWLARFQVLEYVRSFLIGRIFNAKIGCLMVISGAFHKESVIQVGGYSLDIIGEDMDLVMKLHQLMKSKKRKYQIEFSPRAICWTQGPEKVKELHGQRRRWHIGLIQVITKFRHMMLNPKYGTIGMIGMPYQFLYEMIVPVLEVVGCIAIALNFYFKIISVQGLILFTVAGLLFGIIISIGSITAELGVFNRTISFKDLMMLSFLSVIENIIYRPMLFVFKLQAILQYRKYKHRWEPITRQPFKDTK